MFDLGAAVKVLEASKCALGALPPDVARLPGLILRGVMGIAPYPGDPDRAFRTLETVAARLVAEVPGADVISAG